MKPTHSLNAYIEQINSGKTISDKTRIIEKLLLGNQTINSLKQLTGLAHQSLTARVSDLTDLGLVELHYNPASHLSIISLVTDPEKQEQLRIQRFEEKKAAYLKRGKKFGFIAN